MPRFIVDLLSPLQRALAPRAGRAPERASPQSQGEALQAVSELDDHTLWPTHRIRCSLHAPAPRRSGPRR